MKTVLDRPYWGRIGVGLSPSINTFFFVNPNCHHSCTTAGRSFSRPLPKGQSSQNRKQKKRKRETRNKHEKNARKDKKEGENNRNKQIQNKGTKRTIIGGTRRQKGQGTCTKSKITTGRQEEKQNKILGKIYSSKILSFITHELNKRT